MALNASSSKKKIRGHYCCVVGCHRETIRDKDNVNFFRFPTGRRNPEKRQLWIKAVNRKNDDGSDWEPKEWTRICSDHFVGEKHREETNHPDYKPSIFPTSHIRPSSDGDLKRHERARKRVLRDAPAFAPPPARVAKADDGQSEIEVSNVVIVGPFWSFGPFWSSSTAYVGPFWSSSAAYVGPFWSSSAALDAGPFWRSSAVRRLFLSARIQII